VISSRQLFPTMRGRNAQHEIEDNQQAGLEWTRDGASCCIFNAWPAPLQHERSAAREYLGRKLVQLNYEHKTHAFASIPGLSCHVVPAALKGHINGTDWKDTRPAESPLDEHYVGRFSAFYWLWHNYRAIPWAMRLEGSSLQNGFNVIAQRLGGLDTRECLKSPKRLRSEDLTPTMCHLQQRQTNTSCGTSIPKIPRRHAHGSDRDNRPVVHHQGLRKTVRSMAGRRDLGAFRTATQSHSCMTKATGSALTADR